MDLSNSILGGAQLRYLRLIPCTAGRVQSCLRYRLYRTVRFKGKYYLLKKNINIFIFLKNIIYLFFLKILFIY